MKITDWKQQEIKQTPHKVDVRQLYDKTDAQAMHILLQPGEQLKPHITPVDVFFFILEGTPSVQIGDEISVVQENNLVESPKDIVHCLFNHSEGQARILVVKTPKPISNARLL
ncbi:MAG: cupin domain-containing protein [Bacteroidales bacterium]|nr:cupin domain-containing protein [Bacteroidales bacterium]